MVPHRALDVAGSTLHDIVRTPSAQPPAKSTLNMFSLSLLQHTPIYKLATQPHQRVRFHQTRNPHYQQRIREVQFTPARVQDGFS